MSKLGLWRVQTCSDRQNGSVRGKPGWGSFGQKTPCFRMSIPGISDGSMRARPRARPGHGGPGARRAPRARRRRPDGHLVKILIRFVRVLATLFFSKGRARSVAAGLAGGFRRARVGPFGLRGDARGRCRPRQEQIARDGDAEAGAAEAEKCKKARVTLPVLSVLQTVLQHAAEALADKTVPELGTKRGSESTRCRCHCVMRSGFSPSDEDEGGGARECHG